MTTYQHPSKPDIRIEDVRETVSGYVAILVEGEKRTDIEGTWALGGNALSWVRPTGKTERGFRTGKYIVVCGHWQF